MTKRRPGTSSQPAAAFLTLPQAAELIGLSAAELAELIREAGIQPSGPEAEWRLEAADVLSLKSEREKRARQNLTELEKLEGVLPGE